MIEEKKAFIDRQEKWMRFWGTHPEFYHGKDDSEKEKKYVLVEFPYPSGLGLHIGHAFTFTGGDVYARFKRMQGYNVLFPMGWDAFGLPTENYAIKTKQRPQRVTADNTTVFEEQMKKLAFSFDWQRKIDTTDPNYYRWTQWIFVKLFEKGLAYKEEMPINWCPSCKIGLANEEVINGKCERCGTAVERRTISQWVVKITDYADKLLEGLERTNFVEKVKLSQINWIGKREGLNINFVVKNSDLKISCFTKYPETIFGVSWVVVSPEYSDLAKLVTEEQKAAVYEYIKQAAGRSELDRTSGTLEKTGVFTGSYVINPVNNKAIPIWVGDYVLANFGTGAVMGVAPHDSRDFLFAQKYNLEMIQVEVPKDKADYKIDSYEKVIEDGVMIGSEQFNGMQARSEANKAISDWMVEQKWAQYKTEYHLRDWIFSRQHYWGEPIPMIYCEKDGWVTVAEDQLPVALPEVEHYEPTDDGKSPLSKIESFVKTTCPKCGGEAVRETDTMPNWAGSDWYYLGYLLSLKSKVESPKNIFTQQQEKIKHWLPVDVYIGGDEHNTLHLLYSRFIYKFLFDLGVLPNDEPYQKRVSHGVILGPDGARMSKSKGNVVVPETVADTYGVDVVRCYLMFMGPFDGTMAWDEKTLMGVKRFLDRFHVYFSRQISHTKTNSDSKDDTNLIIQRTIKGVTEDVENFRYNTALAKMMEMLNKLSASGFQLSIENVKVGLQLLAPFAPYITEDLYQQVRSEGDPMSVHISRWPKWEEKYLMEEKVTMAVAINGKLRDQIVVESKKIKVESEIIKQAKSTEKIKKWLENKTIIKEIYVPGKMVNLVVEG